MRRANDMTASAITLRSPSLARPAVRVLLAVIVALAALLYVEWRSARVPLAGAGERADTMCMAARIGLPCRS